MLIRIAILIGILYIILLFLRELYHTLSKKTKRALWGNSYPIHKHKPTDSVVDIKLPHKVSGKGSLIPPQVLKSYEQSENKVYEKPIFYGKGTELKIVSYKIKDPFLFYADTFIKEDDLSGVAVYNDVQKQKTKDFMIMYSSRDSYYKMNCEMQEELLKWLAHDRYLIPTEENEWCAFYYVKNIRKQIVTQPDKELLNELLRLYKIYCYRKEYSNVLPYIVQSIESLCYTLQDLSISEKENILDILVIDSEYIIQDGLPKESHKKVKNHITRNTHNIVCILAYYFNKFEQEELSELLPLIVRLLPSQLKKDAQLQKKSVFQTYLKLCLKDYSKDDIFKIDFPEGSDYYIREYIMLPQLMLTEVIDKLHQKIIPYLDTTINSQAERFLALPLILKLHFGFSKKKVVDKLYKKSKYKVVDPQELWNDLGFEELTLSTEHLKNMLEVYYCMGYMCIFDSPNILVYQSENILNSIFSNTKKLSSLVNFAIKIIGDISKSTEIQKSILQYLKIQLELSNVFVEYLSYRMLLDLGKESVNEFYDKDTIENYLYFIIYIQQDFILNKENYIQIYQSFGYSNVEEFVLRCSNKDLLKKNFSHILTIYEPPNNIKKLNLDFDKIQQLEESTKISQIMLHGILGEDDSFNENTVENDIIQQDNEFNMDDIIKILITKDLWNKLELVTVFKSVKVMLNAGIELINEYSEEQYGDILIIENNNEYEINQDVIEEHF